MFLFCDSCERFPSLRSCDSCKRLDQALSSVLYGQKKAGASPRPGFPVGFPLRLLNGFELLLKIGPLELGSQMELILVEKND